MSLKTDHARDQARAQLAHILEAEATLAKAEPGRAYDEALQAIMDNPLSIEVRDGWRMPDPFQVADPEEFLILLCTGGPAVRILGKLDGYCQPSSARLQYQDWGTPWTDLQLTADQETKLLAYCEHFYFGEG